MLQINKSILLKFKGEKYIFKFLVTGRNIILINRIHNVISCMPAYLVTQSCLTLDR